MAKTGSGPFAAVRNICTTLLSTGQTRLALLGNELETEKRRALQQLGLTLALIFCLGMALLMGCGLLLVLLWEQRTAALGLLTLLFLALGVYCQFALRRAGQSAEPMFAASLAELQEDLRQLKKATSDGQDPR